MDLSEQQRNLLGILVDLTLKTRGKNRGEPKGTVGSDSFDGRTLTSLGKRGLIDWRDGTRGEGWQVTPKGYAVFLGPPAELTAIKAAINGELYFSKKGVPLLLWSRDGEKHSVCWFKNIGKYRCFSPAFGGDQEKVDRSLAEVLSFYGQGLSVTGFPNVKLSDAQKERMIEVFKSSGGTVHSGRAETAWPVIEYCKENDIPYRVEVSKFQGEPAGVQVVHGDRPQSDPPCPGWEIEIVEQSEQHDMAMGMR